jgi:hypothetical protein
VLAEAGPLVAPGISLTIGLWALAGLLVGIGLKAGWDHSIGALLRGLANAADVGIWKIKIRGGAGFRKLDDVVQDALGRFVLLNEQALGLWWHANKQLVSYLGDSIVDFGAGTHAAIENLVDGVIPGHVGAATKPLTERIGRANSAAAARDRAEAQARSRGIDATGRDLTAEKLARERGIDNVGARAHGYTDAAVGRVSRSLAAERAYSHRILNRRLTWLEKALGVGALGGIAVAALTRVFPYWQCSNVRRFMRGLCRSPFGSLDWLFGLAALAVVALDPEALERVAEDVSDFLEGIVSRMADV